MKKEGEVVLSFFDGLSCGQIALIELGIKIKKYYSAEIDKFAITQTEHNFPDTIHLGSVTEVKAKDLDKIDLFIGGSPCQGFSFAGKQLNFEDPRSKLFVEFVRVWKEILKINPNAKFLLENVNMKKIHIKVISDYMGVMPVRINSNLVSAQNRDRLYWTNIQTKSYGMFEEIRVSDIPQPKDRKIFLRDILENESEVDKKYILSNNMIKGFLNKKNGFYNRFNPEGININGKCHTLTARYFKQAVTDPYVRICVAMRGRNPNNPNDRSLGAPTEQRLEPKTDGKTNCLTSVSKDNLILQFQKDYKLRRLTPTECARLQTIPDWYIWECSDTQQYKMLGNGWTIEVIKHILSFYKSKK